MRTIEQIKAELDNTYNAYGWIDIEQFIKDLKEYDQGTLEQEQFIKEYCKGKE